MNIRTPLVGAFGVKGTAFVPHDLATAIPGAGSGPLTGLTTVVKDAFDIAGERTGAGSPEWLAAGVAAATTATAVQQVLDAGATIVGKTVCDEFLYSVTGANWHYGTPVNPRAPDRLPGGSSSGSASATAGGACDFALGTDTGGSVRVPAALCGVFGIRTSHGRVAIGGVVPMAPSFDSVGWFAPSAGVLQRIGSVLLGAGRVAASIDRLVVATDLLASADPEVRVAVGRFMSRLHDEFPNRKRSSWPTARSLGGSSASVSSRVLRPGRRSGTGSPPTRRGSARASTNGCGTRQRSPLTRPGMHARDESPSGCGWTRW